MKFFLLITLYVIWKVIGNVVGFHQQVHQSTMRTVYEVQLDYFELINNTETAFTNLEMRIKKFNRTTYMLTGTFETLVEFNDDFTATVTISALQGNEYKVIVPAKDYEKLCTYLATEKIFYPEVQAHSNFPAPGVCPVPPGKWILRDYIAENTQLPELPSAGEKWKSDINLSYKGKSVGHVSIYALVVPKRVRVDE